MLIFRRIFLSNPPDSILKNILDGRKRGYNDMDGLLLLVDFEKAFDSIEWTFLRKDLDSFNFGPSIC
jgi:hypothetical protein